MKYIKATYSENEKVKKSLLKRLIFRLPNGYIFEFQIQTKMGLTFDREKVYHAMYLSKDLVAYSLNTPSPIKFEHVCESYGVPKIEKGIPHPFGGKSTFEILSDKPNIFVHMVCCKLARP